MRIDLVVNPQASQYRRRPALLERVCCSARGRCAVHVTADLDELGGLCRELARRGTDLVILSGGDGTLMAGVTALADAFGPERLPAVAPIPGGTVGTVARNWGVRGTPVRCLRQLLDRPAPAHRRPSIEITAETARGTERRIGFIWGTGLVASFFRSYYEHGAPGHAGAAALVARIFLGSFAGRAYAREVLDPLPCTLEVEGETLAPTAWSLVCCAVVPDLGIHMMVTYRAAEDPQRPHLVASALAPRQLGPRAPLVLAGRRIGGRNHVDRLVRQLVLRFPSVGPYVLDGELLEASRVTVRAGPQIAVVTPARP
ncbi:MAG: hypothetical protein HY744_24245 [Deltaproteobacteria bacterium]|nr:hypothetical protein [Deltaproteobacteria bacterium]